MTNAQERGDTRTVILVHFRRGRVFLEQGGFREAEDDFNAGLTLADTSGIREFDLHLLMGLAETQEKQDHLTEARRLYRRVLDAELPEVSVAEVTKAKREAREALLRVMLTAEERAIPAPWLWTGIVLLSVLLAYALLTGRRRSDAGAANFQQLRPVKRLRVPSYQNPLLRQRLAYIHHVLRNPEATLDALDDPKLKQITCNRDLFLCVAAMEEQATGRTFENDPANTLGRYLRREFRDHHIPWPQTPEAWRRLLDEHGF